LSAPCFAARNINGHAVNIACPVRTQKRYGMVADNFAVCKEYILDDQTDNAYEID